MRIFFFTHYFPPEGNAPASRVDEMAKCWVRAGHRVTVVTCAPNAPSGQIYDGYRNRFRQREQIDGIDVLRVWTYLAANKGTVRRMLNYVSYGFSAFFHSLALGKPDLIIATSPQIFTGWAGLLAHRFLRRPFVLEVRDMWAESITTLISVKKSRVLRLIESIEFSLYRATSHIVTVGDGYKKRLVELGLPPEKISIFTNGVDTELFRPRPPDDALREQWGLEGKYVCSYVGTIGMACQLDVTLRAGQRLKEMGRDDIVFLLVGDGAVREELQAEAARMGLDNVIFTGTQPKEMMPRFHALSNCSLIHLKKTPLFTAVLPSKMFEMFYMKRPIILGVEGEAARILEASGGGICIEPENEEALLAAIDRLQSNPALATQFGQSGHDYVAEHFDRETVASRYLGYLEEIISS
jgi:glycosyltransferase involved in cell wall biosynthesis